MNFLTFLIPHAYSIPFYVIWLGGIIYAITNRQKHPRTALFAGIGLGLLFLESLVSGVLSAYLQYQSFSSKASPIQLGMNLTTLSLCSIPFSMAGWVLLLASVFGWKNPSGQEAIDSHAD